MRELDGKVAIVTGGASGIGEATVRRFVDEGARVAIIDVDEERGQALATDLGAAALFVSANVTRAVDWDRVLADTRNRLGPLDVLVNNAGGGRGGGRLLDEELVAHEHILGLNVSSVWLGTRIAFEAMRENGGGSVINISSIDGLVGASGAASYVASKFAVTGLTRAAAIEGGEFNVRVNAVHPGFVATPLLVGRDPSLLRRVAEAVQRQPLARFGDPREIANAVLFFASEESSFCTGASLVVDGGQIAGSR